MVDVAQLVRALVCGTRGRGFESHLPPKNQKMRASQKRCLFCILLVRCKLVCIRGRRGKKGQQQSCPSFFEFLEVPRGERRGNGGASIPEGMPEAQSHLPPEPSLLE